MRFVFFKHQLTFPRQSGHDVHSAEMMRALVAKGHSVLFLSRTPPDPGALEAVGVAAAESAGDGCCGRGVQTPGAAGQVFLVLGIDPGYAAAVARVCRRHQADVLVAVGLDSLPYLVGPHDAVRVWYAADEWVLHHLSQLRILDRSTWFNVHDAAVKGVYQRAFASERRSGLGRDRSRSLGRPLDRGASAASMSCRMESIPTTSARGRSRSGRHRGVLGPARFRPECSGTRVVRPDRLAGGPRARPDAVFQIIGFKPGDAVRGSAAQPARRSQADVMDLRDEVCRHAVVVVPMVSGLGIKNKLLEAAALGRTVLCTTKATLGLDLPPNAPMVVANRSRRVGGDIASALGRSAGATSLGAPCVDGSSSAIPGHLRPTGAAWRRGNRCRCGRR